jgi:hypothetical protein
MNALQCQRSPWSRDWLRSALVLSIKQVLCAIQGNGHDSTAGPMLHVEGIEQLLCCLKVTILNVEAVEKGTSTYACIILSLSSNDASYKHKINITLRKYFTH